jgi:outer membrane protein TolC
MRTVPIIVMPLVAASIAWAEPLTLDESIKLATERSERIQNAVEDELQAVEEVKSVSTGPHPKVHLKGDYFRRQKTDTAFAGFGGDQQTQDYYISIKQPIYHGLRDVIAKNGAKALVSARRADVEAVRLAIRYDTTGAFFAVLDAQARTALNAAAIELQRATVDAVKRRHEAGDARRSDLLQAEAVLEELLIEAESLAEVEKEARESLRFFVGDPATGEIATPSQPDVEPTEAGARIQAAYRNRAELRSLEHQLDAAALALKAVKRELHPDIDIVANGYAYREGFLEDAEWDINLTAEWELTGWKDRRARAAQERSKASQLRLAVSDARKQIARDVNSALIAIRQSAAMQTKMESHVDKTAELHRIMIEEFKVGEATALEVLSAFTDSQEGQQKLARERLRGLHLKYQLLLITGEDLWQD